MHCCLHFSCLGSDLPLFPFPPPVLVLFGSGGFGSVLTGLAVVVLWLGPLLLGLGVTAQAWVSSFGCSSTATSTLFIFLGFSFTAAAATPGKVSRNRRILNKRRFHKSEKLNDFSGTRVHHWHSARLLLEAKLTFLLAARCLLRVLTKDWCK